MVPSHRLRLEVGAPIRPELPERGQAASDIATTIGAVR